MKTLTKSSVLLYYKYLKYSEVT